MLLQVVHLLEAVVMPPLAFLLLRADPLRSEWAIDGGEHPGVCVRERERVCVRESERERESVCVRERECVCVCLCVCACVCVCVCDML